MQWTFGLLHQMQALLAFPRSGGIFVSGHSSQGPNPKFLILTSSVLAELPGSCSRDPRREVRIFSQRWGGRCRMPVGPFFLTLWDAPAVAPTLLPQLPQGSPLTPLCSELLQTAWEGGSALAVITPFCSSLVLQPL